MKIVLAVAAAVLFFASPSRADNTTLYDVTATAVPCYQIPCVGLETFQMQLTTTLVTGEFDDFYQVPFYGTGPVVTSITGLYDGEYPITEIPVPKAGNVIVANYLLGAFVPVYLDTEADGINFVFDWQGDGISGPGINVTWDMTQVPVPEPAPLLLSGISLAALLCLFGKLKIHEANN